MSREMRTATSHQSLAAGLHPKKQLWDTFRASLESWTVDVEGEGLAALSGVGACFLSDVGEPWLCTTPLVEKYKLAFVRFSRDVMVELMLDVTPKLEGHIYSDFPRGIRFLRALGFDFGETVKMGPRAAPFVKFSKAR
jgi:hypothetical protein